MKLDANFKGGMLTELNSIMESADSDMFSVADTYDAVDATLSGLTHGDGNGIDEMEQIKGFGKESNTGAAGSDDSETEPAVLGSQEESIDGEEEIPAVLSCDTGEGELGTEAPDLVIVDVQSDMEEPCGCECDSNMVDQSLGKDGIVEKVQDVISNNESKMSGQGEFDPLGLFREMFKVDVNQTDNTYGEGFDQDV